MLSNIEKFLAGRKLDVTKKVKIKVKDNEGKEQDLIFEVKSMNREQVSLYNRQAVKILKDGTTEIDDLLLSNLIIKNHCIAPDFNNKDFLAKIGNGMPIRAIDAINKVLTPGEAASLSSAIMQISGMEANNFEILEKEAKDILKNPGE